LCVFSCVQPSEKNETDVNNPAVLVLQPLLMLEMATFDRRIAAVESLARERFDSDCVLGTHFPAFGD
jgi:hypothetical protein